MNLDTFIEQYKPIEENGSIKQFDWTNEQDLEIIKQTEEKYIWTCLDGDSSKLWLTNGSWRINRMFYVICKKSCNKERGEIEFEY